MSSIGAAIVTALEVLDEAVTLLSAADLESLSTADRFEILEHLESSRRRQVAISHDLTAGLKESLGYPSLHAALADWLRISRAEARRRLRDAEQLAPRTSLTGEPLPPQLPATAEAWRKGLLDGDHLRAIQSFIRDVPLAADPLQVETAEAFLAEKAAELRPDQLQKLAERLALTINPDGKFSDRDRAVRRGFTWCGSQRPDGMSYGKLVATPELRSMFDAWFAKFAAPGMCNPDDQRPVTAGEPTEDAVNRDYRGHGQRQHDALIAALRGQLGDPKLGEHRGLPVTVIVSTTLEELERGAGHAVTAGGTLLPIPDLIRMASHAWHYLCVFENHTERPLYLGRTKRIASADQRIVLHCKDRGCTAPGCDAPGYRSEVHHIDEWADGGLTDIDKLTFGCRPDHGLVQPRGWKTRKRKDGRTEWLPPPHLPFPPRVNDFHHPERMLADDSDPDG